MTTFEEFKNQAADILNINLDGYKIKRVQRRTDSLMRRHNISDYERCLFLLENDPEFKEAYLNHFTINTSEFFRNPKNFTYLKENIFPPLFKKHQKVKIWSAPCSNGSEPYTLAIILSELNLDPGRYEILASDLDKNILETARKGVYGPNSLQNVSDKILQKYFKKIPGNSIKYQLNKDIIKQIRFEQADLINEPYQKDWNLILSRNFFIYLTREIKKQLIKKFTEALKPDGYFFLGNTEFIFNSEEYNLKKVYSSFYKKLA